MMTRSVMDIEFASTIPNLTLDLSGATMRTTLSYLDPPVTGDRLITRNGSVFHLATQGNEGAKEFLRHVPPCPDMQFDFGMTSSETIAPLTEFLSSPTSAFATTPIPLLASLLVMIQILSSIMPRMERARVKRTFLVRFLCTC